LTKTFIWHSAGYYFLIFLGLLAYVIVALVVRRKVRIDIPFCEVHRSWRTHMNVAGAVLLIVSVPASYLLMSLEVNGGMVAIVVLGMAFSGLVVLAIVGSSFTSVYIDKKCAKFKGAGEQFLSLLPSSPASLQQGLAR
jgi:hypothetical protein